MLRQANFTSLLKWLAVRFSLLVRGLTELTREGEVPLGSNGPSVFEAIPRRQTVPATVPATYIPRTTYVRFGMMYGIE